MVKIEFGPDLVFFQSLCFPSSLPPSSLLSLPLILSPSLPPSVSLSFSFSLSLSLSLSALKKSSLRCNYLPKNGTFNVYNLRDLNISIHSWNHHYKVWNIASPAKASSCPPFCVCVWGEHWIWDSLPTNVLVYSRVNCRHCTDIRSLELILSNWDVTHIDLTPVRMAIIDKTKQQNKR